jgi:hypothetical protein
MNQAIFGRRVALAAVCGSTLMMVAACGGPVEVTPGSLHYPKLNVHSEKRIDFVLSGAPPSEVRVTVVYGAHQHAIGCYTRVGLSELASYSVLEDLRFVRRPDGSYVSVIIPDKFVPGRCKWDITNIDMDVPIQGNHQAMPFAVFISRDYINSKALPYNTSYTTEWNCPDIRRKFCHASNTLILKQDWPMEQPGTLYWNITHKAG